MENNNKSWIVVTLIVGLVLGYLVGTVQTASRTAQSDMISDGHMDIMNKMMDSPSDMSGVMDDMMGGLSGKSGDAFDKAFLEEMVVHHRGAVEMATAALSSAKHQEIKDLAQAIIAAQEKEISQMKSWKTTWYR